MLIEYLNVKFGSQRWHSVLRNFERCLVLAALSVVNVRLAIFCCCYCSVKCRLRLYSLLSKRYVHTVISDVCGEEGPCVGRRRRGLRLTAAALATTHACRMSDGLLRSRVDEAAR